VSRGRGALSASKTRGKQVVISTLVGGLGNQMFQYAAGRALALRRGSELQLDVGWLHPASPTSRFRYELGSFPVEADLISAYRHRRREQLRERLGLAPPARRYTAFPFDPAVLELPGRVRLTGYWQSEKYFQDQEAVIRVEFSRTDPLDAPNEATAAEIAASTAVCVSVRRGDYVTDPEINRYHGVLPLEYYTAGVELVRRSLPDARFFVFSDDLDWCRVNLRLGGPMTFVDHDQNRPADDLRLMALCPHHIIANSTFSWWGAWLAAGRDGIVVAPKQWAVAEDVGPDLIPERWVRL
jgi:hypothetical protein